MKSPFILILSCSLFSLTGCAEPPDPAMVLLLHSMVQQDRSMAAFKQREVLDSRADTQDSVNSMQRTLDNSQAHTQDFLSNMEGMRSEAQRRCRKGDRSACIDVHSIETDEAAAQRDQSAQGKISTRISVIQVDYQFGKTVQSA